MAELLGLGEIAKRMNVEISTVRRLLAREGDALGIKTVRGKGLKLFLSSEDAETLIANYEARRGPIEGTTEKAATFDRYGFF